MQGHVARKGNRWYAVVHEGTDPQTGKERRRWHPAGTDRAQAERLADELATTAARRRAERKTGLTLESFVDRVPRGPGGSRYMPLNRGFVVRSSRPVSPGPGLSHG